MSINWGFLGRFRRLLEFPNGDTDTAVSPAQRARMKYSYTNDQMLVSTNGGAYLALTPGGAGGAVVDNLTILGAVDETLLSDGVAIYVNSLDAPWTLDKNATTAADGITVIATNSGTGRWFRQQTPSQRWASQATWYVDATGDDENDGLTAGTALATTEELFNRRLRNAVITQNVTVNFTSDITDTEDIQVSMALLGSTFTLQGTRTLVTSSTLQTVTASTNTSTTVWIDATETWTTWRGYLLNNDTIDTGDDALAWPEGLQADRSQGYKFVDRWGGTTVGEGANGNAYSVYALTAWDQPSLEIAVSGDGTLEAYDMEFFGEPFSINSSQETYLYFSACSIASTSMRVQQCWLDMSSCFCESGVNVYEGARLFLYTHSHYNLGPRNHGAFVYLNGDCYMGQATLNIYDAKGSTMLANVSGSLMKRSGGISDVNYGTIWFPSSTDIKGACSNGFSGMNGGGKVYFFRNVAQTFDQYLLCSFSGNAVSLGGINYTAAGIGAGKVDAATLSGVMGTPNIQQPV